MLFLESPWPILIVGLVVETIWRLRGFARAGAVLAAMGAWPWWCCWGC